MHSGQPQGLHEHAEGPGAAGGMHAGERASEASQVALFAHVGSDALLEERRRPWAWSALAGLEGRQILEASGSESAESGSPCRQALAGRQ